MKLDDQTLLLRYTLAPTSAYYAATRALTKGHVSTDELVLLARIVQRRTFAVLVQLGRERHDWCAWVPLLLLIMRVRRGLALEDLRAAEHNLRLLARRLLDAQDFRRVRVDRHPSTRRSTSRNTRRRSDARPRAATVVAPRVSRSASRSACSTTSRWSPSRLTFS
jgi:hypothetical protein